MERVSPTQLKDDQTILEILFKIKNSDKSLTLVEAAVILCDHFGITYEDFAEKCGKLTIQYLEKDAISNRQIRR